MVTFTLSGVYSEVPDCLGLNHPKPRRAESALGRLMLRQCSSSEERYGSEYLASVFYVIVQVDHFAFGAAGHATFDQRYFICNPLNLSSDQVETVFFYFGNEDTVILYVNHTGLMWESAQEFNAILIFAEHRYYGESVPAYRESAS